MRAAVEMYHALPCVHSLTRTLACTHIDTDTTPKWLGDKDVFRVTKQGGKSDGNTAAAYILRTNQILSTHVCMLILVVKTLK